MLTDTLTQPHSLSVCPPACLPACLLACPPPLCRPHIQSLVRTFPGMSDYPLIEGIKGLAGVVVDSVNRWGAVECLYLSLLACELHERAACLWLWLCLCNNMRMAACLCLSLLACESHERGLVWLSLCCYVGLLVCEPHEGM